MSKPPGAPYAIRGKPWYWGVYDEQCRPLRGPYIPAMVPAILDEDWHDILPDFIRAAVETGRQVEIRVLEKGE